MDSHPLTDTPSRSLWARARWLAERTPETRNRYVDFLRALSILAVVAGHWLMAAAHFDGQSPRLDHLLEVAPWTQWLTWLLQVMPVFFFVGGYSNGTSWRAARRKGQGYREWLDSRVRRLVGPVLPLLVAWGAMAAVARSQGVGPGMIRVGSQVALVPVWFLAVYVLVVLVVPATQAAWQRFGFLSVALPVAGAALVDLAFFAAGWHTLGWVNYLLVWLAVHQLGYAWHDRRMAGVRVALPCLLLGLLLLVGLVTLGPYPRSLVSVPGEAVSNTLPPKLPLLALAAAQIGLVLTLEGAARRWLARLLPWAVTVLVSGMIMTVFLWHSTVMMLLVGLAFWQAPLLLAPQPATALWWWTRPLWLSAYALASLPFLLLFARFERGEPAGTSRPVAAWRQVSGCVLCCAGLAYLALDGVGGDGWLGLRWAPLLLPFAGAGLAGFGPLGLLGLRRRGEGPQGDVAATNR